MNTPLIPHVMKPERLECIGSAQHTEAVAISLQCMRMSQTAIPVTTPAILFHRMQIQVKTGKVFRKITLNGNPHLILKSSFIIGKFTRAAIMGIPAKLVTLSLFYEPVS